MYFVPNIDVRDADNANIAHKLLQRWDSEWKRLIQVSGQFSAIQGHSKS